MNYQPFSPAPFRATVRAVDGRAVSITAQRDSIAVEWGGCAPVFVLDAKTADALMAALMGAHQHIQDQARAARLERELSPRGDWNIPARLRRAGAL